MKNADSIKARLRNLATQANMPYEYILTHYFIECVAADSQVEICR